MWDEPPPDLDRLLEDARWQGRRQGLVDAVKAVRIAIDARFRLQPMELDLGELPDGLDSGELLEQLNFFLIEFGNRCYIDGKTFHERFMEEEEEEPWK